MKNSKDIIWANDIISIKGVAAMNKIVILVMVLISLSFLTCISAADLNTTDVDLQSVQDGDCQLELEISADADNSTDEILSASSQDKTDDESYLILDNDGDSENIHVGDYETWTISVENKGPDTARNVKVHNQLPDGLKYVKHHTTKGTFNPKTGVWNIGNLSADEGEVFLYVTTKAITPGEKINKAFVTTDSINLNENNSFEQEEIDVFEYGDYSNPSYTSKAAYASKTIHETGNPIALIFCSLFALAFVTRKLK